MKRKAVIYQCELCERDGYYEKDVLGCSIDKRGFLDAFNSDASKFKECKKHICRICYRALGGCFQ